MEPDKRKRIFLVLGAVTFIAILAVIWLTLAASRTHRVEITVVPSDSKLTIDGEPAKAGTLSLKPGKHTLKATRQYFDAVTKEIDTTTLKPNQVVYVVLGGRSPEAQAYLEAHPEEFLLYERAIGAEFSETQEKLLDDYPFVKTLPYESLDFKIDYAVDEKKKVSLKVELYPVATVPGTPEYKNQLTEFKKQALDYIKSQGVDTSKIPVTFTPDPDTL